MVSSRKSRNYKEKRPMFAFGQLILPIAAILALGLLFTGIKLFFFSPSTANGAKPIEYIPSAVSRDNPVAEVGGASGDALDQGGAVGAKTPASPVILAGPVDPSSEVVTPVMKPLNVAKKPVVQKPTPQKVTTPAKPVEKPQPQREKPAPVKQDIKTKKDPKANPPAKPVRQEPVKPTVADRPAAKTPSPSIVASIKPGTLWGVQIGAFTKRDGADILAEQATKDGYSPIVSQYEVEGKQFFRVRVKSGTDRDVAATVAAELEKKGYPVALIPLE